MPVKIVTGNIGAGKTAYCVDEMRKKHEAQPERKCIMLVPSYYSHETEKMLIEEFGGTGLNNIEVTSFEKMARELLSGTENRLSAPGKQALICRAVEQCLSELEKRKDEFDAKLISAVSKQGFLEVAQSLISEMHRYVVTGCEIRERAEQTEKGILKQKLEITAMISDNYDKLLAATEYIDSDEDLLRLAETAGESVNENTSIWMDKFDELLPQQMQVLMALIDGGADITITFNTCDNDEDTYYGTRAAIAAITGYSNAVTVHLDGGMGHLKNAPDLKFLFSNWFDRARYGGAVENAEIFEGRDAYTEIEHIACRILDFVREDKYRFRDISVICGRPDSYSHIIEAIFDEYDIPYYSDESLSIAEHPIAMQILSLFDVIENNWSYGAVFEYLRAGFVYTAIKSKNGIKRYRRVPSDKIDTLENYVLKYGIRGRSMWCRSWAEGQKNAVEEALGSGEKKTKDVDAETDVLRETLMAPVFAYCDAVKEADTVTDYCCALYRFLEDINLYNGLKAELLAMAMNRATADAQRFGQIWNLVLDVLDQVNTALGQYRVTHEEFCGYIRAAMTQCRIRTVPSGVDRVFIGSVEKNQSVNPKIIFMAGAVSGTFPTETAVEGFLSNADREYLADNNINLAPVTAKRNSKLYNSVYKVLSAVTDRLCISYPVQTPDGKGCRAARTVIDICDKLPGIRVYNDIIVTPEEERRMFISSPKATLHKLLIHPKPHPLWTHVNEWFNEHGEWRNKLFTVSRARHNYTDRVISLSPQFSHALYRGQIMYSATRLNCYAECPFRYFLQYGLNAKEREEWELNAADTGSYAHEIIRRFCEYIDNDEGLDWSNADDDTCDEIVDGIVKDTLERINSADIKDKERTADIFRRMGKTVKEAAKTVRRSIASGDFSIAAYEKRINTSVTDKVGVTGIIDRLDVCSHDGVNEYRIIDYKTGKQEFKVSEVYNRYYMQPVIYAMAMRMLDDEAMISGMYYSRVRNDYAHIESKSRDSTALTHLKKNTELSGVTFVDTDAHGDIKQESLNRVESEAARMNGSLFFGKKTELGKNIQDRETGERLIELVRSNVISMDEEIRNGNIGISPLVVDSRHNACTYCAYSSACKFDEGFSQKRPIKEKDSEIWKLLKGDE